jgi:NTP pyrophosphatase (non-canonical NTP hydrolase)
MSNAPFIAVKGSRAEISPHESIPHISVQNHLRALRWHPSGLQEWSLSDWAVAVAGEVGEMCNVVKKMNRVRDGIVGNKEKPEDLQGMLSDEIADVYIYLDLFARRAGLNLEDCIRAKFNATSERVGFPERL